MNDLPSRESVLEHERRWLRPAGLTAIAGALLFVAGVLLEQIGLPRADTFPERLTQFHDHASKLIAGEILQGIGFALFALPLWVLFRAAADRSEKVRRSLIAFAFVGPLLFGVSTVILAFGFKEAGDKFVEQAPAAEQQARDEAAAQQTEPKPTEPKGKGGESTATIPTTTTEEDSNTPDDAADDAREDLADDVFGDSNLVKIGQGLRIPGILGLLFVMIYVCLWAMRTGLLTRFWGTLGMALGASIIFLGILSVMGLVAWFAALGTMFLGRWPGGLPPAWAEGRAIPWLPPGEQPREGETVDDGSGREVSEPALPEEGDPDRPVGAAPDEPEGETQGQRRKKRKRRP